MTKKNIGKSIILIIIAIALIVGFILSPTGKDLYKGMLPRRLENCTPDDPKDGQKACGFRYSSKDGMWHRMK